VAFLAEDRELGPDMEAVVKLLEVELAMRIDLYVKDLE
jgi:hypothetical protein